MQEQRELKPIYVECELRYDLRESIERHHGAHYPGTLREISHVEATGEVCLLQGRRTGLTHSRRTEQPRLDQIIKPLGEGWETGRMLGEEHRPEQLCPEQREQHILEQIIKSLRFAIKFIL